MSDTGSPPAGFSPTIFELNIPFVENFFPTFERIDSDDVTIGARVTAACCNAGKSAHGAFLMALGDFATTRAAFQRVGTRNRFTVHVSFTMNFYAAAPAGCWLEALARVNRQGKSLLFTSCDFFADGQLIGHADAILKSSERKKATT